MESDNHNERSIVPQLNLVAWEVTRSCNLGCRHCRASANNSHYPDELSTSECFHLIDEIRAAGTPIIILTGGEPLMRHDIFDIGRYAVSKGLRVVMGTNGTLISDQIAAELKKVPVS
jgi:AdoMet-dependent heme synthase